MGSTHPRTGTRSASVPQGGGTCDAAGGCPMWRPVTRSGASSDAG